MDVVIKNGYILPAMSLQELHSFAQEYRRQIRALSKKLIIERLGNMCMGYIDFVSLPENKRTFFTEMNRQLFLDQDALNHSSFYSAYSKMQEIEQRIITEKIKKPEYDYLCEVVFFPSDNYILAMLFAEQSAYVETFKRMPGVQEYFYWNNTEVPDDVTKRDWNTRKERWDIAAGYTGIPSLEGFNVPCYIQLPFIDPNDVHKYIKERFNMDVRTNNYASKIVILRKYRELADKQNLLFGTEELYKEATKFLRTEEGKKLYDQEVELLKEAFKPEIESDDLLTSLNLFVNKN